MNLKRTPILLIFASSVGWAAHVSTGAVTGAAALGDTNLSTGMSAPNNPNNGYQSSAARSAQSTRSQEEEPSADNAAGMAAPLAPADAPENAPQVQSRPK